MVSVFKACLPLAMIALVGCAPQTPAEMYQAGMPYRGFAYKAGVTPDIMLRDQTACEVQAARDVPQQMVVSTTPTYTTPVQT